ncbi:MAG TPA: type I-F CRISPR-associated endoribonuclease Cas6/Csy4 [Halothiobacillus sp.]|nr:type I-F CRISPR-associated endoribonuclease Cas6/Csy4 [Halothiobacillus sp.]
MKPDHYADIELSGKSIPAIAAKVVQRLHPFMSEHKDTYALAFPGIRVGMESGEQPRIGGCVRLFANSREAIEQALDHLEIGIVSGSDFVTEKQLSPLIHIGRVRKVPDDYDGTWVTYHRFRIPSRRGKSEQHQEKRLKLRSRRLQESRVLPYLILQSASTRQTFSLIIQSQEHKVGTGITGILDGYGFSSKEAPVYLPSLQ